MDLFKAAHWLFLLDPLAKAGFCLLSRGGFPHFAHSPLCKKMKGSR